MVSLSVGEFKLVDIVDQFNKVNIFTHPISVEKTTSKFYFKVYPKIGQIWVMYRMLLLKSKTQNKLQYEMVEIQTNFFY